MEALTRARRIVVKVGTRVALGPLIKGAKQRRSASLLSPNMQSILALCETWQGEGKEVILVVSGAISYGQRLLGRAQVRKVEDQQACASVGQPLLLGDLRELSSRPLAQVLLTSQDLSQRGSYLKVRGMLERLLTLKALPVVNENDTVSTDELQGSHTFGDNDKLSALVASKMGADVLVLLTDVKGIFTANPKRSEKAIQLTEVQRLEALSEIRTLGKSPSGRGGMATKVEAARLAALCGVDVLIASGMGEVSQNLKQGTLVHGQGPRTGSKKRWLASTSNASGTLVVNDGAARALVDRGASLLPAGLVSVKGRFGAKSIVDVCDEAGVEVGKGVCLMSSAELRKVVGLKTTEISKVLGRRSSGVVVHRDQLVVFGNYVRKGKSS